ncbi:MAG TPA: MFS transporter, partial [Polyangiaceae bacterium LLY-WYZ-15_(1-7)]|nr:MFS transporter [Polyangiaceae bacterium LLY-WYZ-15_(1-7)]
RMGLVAGVGTSGLLVGPALGGLLAPIDLDLPVLVALIVSAGLTLTLVFWRPAPPASSGAGAGAEVERPATAGEAFRELARLARNVAFLALMLPIAFNKLTFSAFQGLLPLVGPDAYDLGSRGVTLLFVLTGVVFALSQPVGGFLADRFRARSVALFFTPPLLAALVGMAFASSATLFAVAYGSYIGASSIIFTATMKHAATAWGSDDTYGGVFGLLSTLTDTMTIVGPLLFINLYAALGGGVFWAMAAVGLPFALAYALWGRRT